MLKLPLPALILMALTLSACGDDDRGAHPASEPSVVGAPLEGTIHLLSFSRLNGYAEGWPCTDAWPSPLPAAGVLRQRLEAGGASALIALIGDALRQPGGITKNRAALEGGRARAEVLMDAMVAAGVGVWVPGHGDLSLWGGQGLFERAAARGLTLLATNMDGAPGDTVRPYVIVRDGTLRIALLGVLPLQSADSEDVIDNDSAFSLVRPQQRVKEVARALLDQGEADFVVVLSSLAGKSNEALCDIEDVHFILGSSDGGLKADRVARRHGTGLMYQEPNGREVGHTTWRVTDGNLDLVDLSPLWSLPPVLAQEEQHLKEWEAAFGTLDPNVLAPRVAPGFEADFLVKFELNLANKRFLEEWADYTGSSITHRAAELPANEPGNAVLAVLAEQGEAIRLAAEGSRAPLGEIDPGSDISDPAACRACHPAQFEHWANTDHANAWLTLQSVNRHRDSSCLHCHAAGFGKTGGFVDPRLDAPFGGYTCWNCHGTKNYHYLTKRGVVEPASNPVVGREQIGTLCTNCHSEQRSPGFDPKAALARVACPPLAPQEPALVDAYAKALLAVERNRAEGTETDRDDYFQARALMGLGRHQEAIPLLDRYSRTLVEYPLGITEMASYLDRRTYSRQAASLLQGALARKPSDPILAKAYAEILLHPKDASVRDPATAAAYLAQALPFNPEAKMSAEELPIRQLQVEAFFGAGRREEGQQLLVFLTNNFTVSDELEALIARYLAP